MSQQAFCNWATLRMFLVWLSHPATVSARITLTQHRVIGKPNSRSLQYAPPVRPPVFAPGSSPNPQLESLDRGPCGQHCMRASIRGHADAGPLAELLAPSRSAMFLNLGPAFLTQAVVWPQVSLQGVFACGPDGHHLIVSPCGETVRVNLAVGAPVRPLLRRSVPQQILKGK